MTAAYFIAAGDLCKALGTDMASAANRDRMQNTMRIVMDLDGAQIAVAAALLLRRHLEVLNAVHAEQGWEPFDINRAIDVIVEAATQAEPDA